MSESKVSSVPTYDSGTAGSAYPSKSPCCRVTPVRIAVHQQRADQRRNGRPVIQVFERKGCLPKLVFSSLCKEEPEHDGSQGRAGRKSLAFQLRNDYRQVSLVAAHSAQLLPNATLPFEAHASLVPGCRLNALQ